MPRKEFFVPLDSLDDLDLVAQAFMNVGDSIEGSTKFALHAVANELKRLRRVQGEQRRKTYERQQAEYALHFQKTGEKHPLDNDDIPF